MTFNARESSIYEGQPIRLYEFKRGATTYRYTSCDRDIVKDGATFVSVAGGVSDTGVNQTGEVVPDNLVITVAYDNAVAQLFRGFPPSVPLTLIVYYGHYTDNNWIVVWSGEVRSVKWPSLAVAEITCSPFTRRMETTGLRLGWVRNCPYAVYSELCGVNRDLFYSTFTLTTKTNTTITDTVIGSQADGWWTAGMISWEVDGGSVIEYRGVESHTSTTISIYGDTADIPLGTIIKIYPGCKQTVDSCKNKFNNLNNYGGVPSMSGKSPYDGNNYY